MSAAIPRRRTRWFAVAALLAALVLSSTAMRSTGPAHAAGLVSSNPPDHSTVTLEPSSLTLTFDSAVKSSPASVIDVRLNGRELVEGGLSLDSATGTMLTASLRPDAGPGIYSVGWIGVDAGDGSFTSGFLSFTVGGAPVAMAAPAAASDGPAPLFNTGDGNGDGWVQFTDVAGGRMVQIFLEHATPSTAYTVQLCDLLALSCTAVDPSFTITTSDTGTVFAVLLIPAAPLRSGAAITSTADPLETYDAQPLDEPPPLTPNLTLPAP